MDLIVNVTEIKSIVSNTSKILKELEESLNDYKTFAVGKTDLWESKYQKVYDKHILKSFIPYCNKITNNFVKLNNYLDKTVDKYEKLDYLRK